METLSRRSLKTCTKLIAAFLAAIALAALANPSAFHGFAAPSVGSNFKSVRLNPKADQTITFPNIPSRTLGDSPFAISASASSGLEVSVTASGLCTVQGSMVQLTGVGSCTLTASQAGDDDYNEAPSVSRSFFIGNAGETVLDLSSFGATGDGVTDDAPALQAALDALANAGGGTLFVPPGRYVLATPVSRVFTGLASLIAIRGVESNTLVDIHGAGAELAQGLALSSEIYPRTNQQIALGIAGLKTLLVADIAFVGTPNVGTDAAVTLYLSEVEDATIHHCEFYGLRTSAGTAGVVFAYLSGLRIQQTKFLGTFGDSSVNTPVVQNIEWKNISLSDVAFVDYGSRPELYCKCEGATYSWVTVGNAAATSADSPRREASLRNVFMDEGGLTGLFSLPSSFQPPSAPIDLIYISNLRMNVSNLNAWGNYLTGIQRVLIENAKYEWSHNASAAIQLIDAGNVIIDKTECVDAANRIAADYSTQKLTVINSTYTYLDSQAQTTKTLLVSDEDDPVQYVRTQFEQALGRAPDPAAHFYWSDLLLQCDQNLQCLSEKQNDLTQYLNTAPSANFSISGQIKDEHGSAMSGVVVALSGSQSVSTQTDAEGRYSFSGLPTSGLYTVTASPAHYNFQDPERTITTPAGDQTINFDAAPETAIEFSDASYSVSESTFDLVVTINRVGDTAGVSAIDFTTIDDAGLQDCNVINGKASPRCDFSFTISTVQFAAGDTSKTISIPIVDGGYVEGSETFNIRLTNPIGALLGEVDSATVTITDNDTGSGANPVSDTDFFIRQHYLDFLGREPDPAGFEGWRNILNNCGITIPQPCDRIEVSSAFFRSPEFQGRGYFVYRFYASVGQVPLYDQFAVDLGALSGFLTPEQLEAEKVAFANEFLDREEFHSKYDALTSPAAYVEGLLQTVNLPSHPSRQSWIDGLTNGSLTRAEALRALVESTEMYQKYYNEAFVVMQYFGYLRRTADASYLQWIQTMNSNGGDYRVMVSGFLNSLEYRHRFGP